METMIMKLLFLAPYLGLKDLVISVLDEYKDIEIDVYHGNYKTGPKLLHKLDADKKYDAIITRGGTAETCRKITVLPIIEVYINAFDILRILKLSQGYEGKKVFLAFPTLVKSFKQLSELLGYSIESQCYFQHDDIKYIMRQLKKENCELVIGDNIVYETAQEFGLNSILLTSGIESIRSSIDEAVRLCNALSKGSKQIKKINIIEDRKTKDFPIDSFVRIITPKDISPNLIHTIFPKTIISQISELSNTSLPTIITGEDGMCKSDIGYLCSFYGPQRKKTLMSISCYCIPEKYNYDLLNDFINKYLYKDGGTLFLEDIDTLHKDSQKKLTTILKRLIKNTNIKIIASCELPVEICIKNGHMLRQLRSLLDEVRIELKPFKSYKNEISNMISMYLAKLNVRCASQVVEINKDGINLLCEYNWPENIRQFMRVINQLTLTCNGSYISSNQVRAALHLEKDNHKKSNLVPIDLSGSLNDIETRIINHILIEENMNQANVERRLKIAHSTLWRKLK